LAKSGFQLCIYFDAVRKFNDFATISKINANFVTSISPTKQLVGEAARDPPSQKNCDCRYTRRLCKRRKVPAKSSPLATDVVSRGDFAGTLRHEKLL